MRHGLASPAESQQGIPIDIDDLAQALIELGADEAQIVSSRRAAWAHVELLRVRAVRAALLASFDPKGCNVDDARRLQGCSPPQQIIDQCLGRRLKLGQSSLDVAALG